MEHASVERIKEELDTIDREGRIRIIEYLVRCLKHDMNTTKLTNHFEDLSGKLKWRGDPVEEQRVIRNEW